MSKNGSKFALGAIVGTAIGAVAGILAAPKSGKETRQDIKTKAKETKLKADKKYSDTKDSAKAKADQAKAKAEDIKSRGENAVDGARHGFNKKP